MQKLVAMLELPCSHPGGPQTVEIIASPICQNILNQSLEARWDRPSGQSGGR